MDYMRKGQLVITRWTDKREVVTLSTIHPPRLQITQGRYERKEKPVAIANYTKFKVGVDHSEQLLSFFPMKRKAMKWWKAPFCSLKDEKSRRFSVHGAHMVVESQKKMAVGSKSLGNMHCKGVSHPLHMP